MGDLAPVKFVKIDNISGKEVVSREVPKMYRYKLGPNNERIDVEEIPQDQVQEHVSFDEEYHVFAKNERRYFLKDELEVSGKWIEVPVAQVLTNRQTEQRLNPSTEPPRSMLNQTVLSPWRGLRNTSSRKYTSYLQILTRKSKRLLLA